MRLADLKGNRWPLAVVVLGLAIVRFRRDLAPTTRRGQSADPQQRGTEAVAA